MSTRQTDRTGPIVPYPPMLRRYGTYSTRRSALRAVVVAFSLFCGISLSLAQIDSTVANDAEAVVALEVYAGPADNFLGFERRPLTTRVVVLDSHLVERTSSIWADLDPLDLLATGRTSRTALLLARTSGLTVLYRVSTEEPLTIEPIWQHPGHGFSRLQRDHWRQRTLISGDSGIVVLEPDSSSRRLSSFRLAAAPIVGRNGLVLFQRSPIGLIAGVYNGSSYRSEGNVRIGSERAEIHGPVSDGARKVVVLGNPSWTVVTVGPDGAVASRPATPVKNAVGLFGSVSITGARQNLPILSSTIPRPWLVDAISGDRRDLVYPLSTPPEVVLQSEHGPVVVAADSVLLYGDENNVVSIASNPGGARPRLLSIGEELYLSTTTGTSRFHPVEHNPAAWILEHAPTIVAGLVALLVLIASLLLFSRYRRMRATYRTFVDGGDVSGVMILSRRGTVVRCNAASLTLLGWPADTPAGRHALAYFQGEELGELRDHVAAHVREGTPIGQQLTIGREGTARIVRLRLRRMSGRYGSNQGSLLLLDDLTEAIEQERLLNWASVAHHIAHEMKTPLGTIRATTEVLRKAVSAADELADLREGIGRIGRSAARLREVVEDLLTVARSEALRTQSIDIAMFLRSIVDEIRDYIPDNITMMLHGDEAPCAIVVDPELLAVAIRNLVDNAKEAVGSRDHGAIDIRIVQRDQAVGIEVTDNGIGMSAETVANFFQPFYTRKKEGSGLGTVIVRRVVDGHNGSIEIDSKLGAGTTISVTIPIGSPR